MRISKATILTGLALFALATPPLMADDERPVPEVFSNVVQCTNISDDSSRLACFDAAVAKLADAAEADDLVVMSREEVRETRRGLFGLRLPAIRLFGGKDEDDGIEALKRIETTLASVGRGQSGFSFRLEDGAVWDQTDNAYMRTPKAGDPIVIERAALGSYFARVNDGIAARVRRRN